VTAAEAPAVGCPRCGKALEPATLREVPVHACKGCQGTLLAQLDLPRTLESLSAPLLRSFDPDAKLERAKPDGSRIDCPKCKRRMERDDYCAAGLVLFDRCTPCALLWFDADELGAMTLMWAKMNARIAEHRQAMASTASGGVLVVDRMYLGASVWGMVAVGAWAADALADSIFDDSDVW
jgi:Zn-finger nucleic acid-binding protein